MFLFNLSLFSCQIPRLRNKSQNNEKVGRGGGAGTEKRNNNRIYKIIIIVVIVYWCGERRVGLMR